MASSSSKVTIIIFLLLTACSLSFFSIQIQARQLFNKVSSIEEPSLPMKQKAAPEEEQEERDPSFYAQTESSYGLYGRDSDQLTSETPTYYKPYVTPVRYHADEPYNAIPSNNNNNEKQQQNLEEARLGERNTFYNNNLINDENTDHHVFGNDGKLQQQNNNNFEEEARNNYYVNNNNEEQIADQRQGMSDTRFLENGKYYYGINTEIRNTKYPQTAHATHDDLIYNGRRSNYYGNLQGRRNANYNNIDQNNYQQFNGQP